MIVAILVELRKDAFYAFGRPMASLEGCKTDTRYRAVPGYRQNLKGPYSGRIIGTPVAAESSFVSRPSARGAKRVTNDRERRRADHARFFTVSPAHEPIRIAPFYAAFDVAAVHSDGRRTNETAAVCEGRSLNGDFDDDASRASASKACRTCSRVVLALGPFSNVRISTRI